MAFTCAKPSALLMGKRCDKVLDGLLFPKALSPTQKFNHFFAKLPALEDAPWYLVEDYFKRALCDYALADFERHIPSTVDGLTPVQRTIAFQMLRKLHSGAYDTSTRLSTGFVGDEAGCEHGHKSISDAIPRFAEKWSGVDLVSLSTYAIGDDNIKSFIANRYYYFFIGDLARYITYMTGGAGTLI